MHAAATGGHSECVRVLLENGANPAKVLELSRVLSALHVASSVAVVHVLIEHGAPLHHPDPRVPSPSWYHRSQNREDVAEAIEEYYIVEKKKKTNKKTAWKNLGNVFRRLRGMVRGLRFIRNFQVRWKERFYDPENRNGFLRIADIRYNKFASCPNLSINELIKIVKRTVPKVKITDVLPLKRLQGKQCGLHPQKRSSANEGLKGCAAGSGGEAIRMLLERSSENLRIPQIVPIPPSENVAVLLPAASPSKPRRQPGSLTRRKCKSLASDSLNNQRAVQPSSDVCREGYKVGDSVLVKNLFPGRLEFIGETCFSRGKMWFGVALDGPNGKNNGTVNGTRYFQCDSSHGIFVQHKSIAPLINGAALENDKEILGMNPIGNLTLFS